MRQRKHIDEARAAALELLDKLVAGAERDVRYAALVIDLYGRVSLVAWVAEGAEPDLASHFAQACGEHWTGTVIISRAATPADDDDAVARTAWREGTPHGERDRARVTDRFRHHTAWRSTTADTRPLWALGDGPPIVVFHAFKGGAGRTTLLAGYALACARRGERVAVVDVDLDAPGIGTLLAADPQGTTAAWGTVDYLLESANPHPIEDYLHVCARSPLTGEGRIEVVPAGRLNDGYLPKLARVDLDLHGAPERHPLAKLIEALRAREPHRILLDGRAGLSSSAGLLLSGLAHLHVIVGTSNPQSLAGLELVVRHLGYDAARRGLAQADCVIVQALVPEVAASAAPARDAFAGRVEAIFRNEYYAQQPTEDDSVWSLDDLESQVAPHVPVPISYRAALAHYTSLDEIAEILAADSERAALYARIDERFGAEEGDG